MTQKKQFGDHTHQSWLAARAQSENLISGDDIKHSYPNLRPASIENGLRTPTDVIQTPGDRANQPSFRPNKLDTIDASTKRQVPIPGIICPSLFLLLQKPELAFKAVSATGPIRVFPVEPCAYTLFLF